MKNLLFILLPVICYGLGVATSHVFYQHKLKALRDRFSRSLSNVARGTIDYVDELETQWKEKRSLKSERDKYKKLAYEMDEARKKAVHERDMLRDSK